MAEVSSFRISSTCSRFTAVAGLKDFGEHAISSAGSKATANSSICSHSPFSAVAIRSFRLAASGEKGDGLGGLLRVLAPGLLQVVPHLPPRAGNLAEQSLNFAYRCGILVNIRVN